ncbi:hypothetical protein ACKKBG_A26775 [Auxenochlorella protothecoides x Auxenochlorella symbiontica]
MWDYSGAPRCSFSHRGNDAGIAKGRVDGRQRLHEVNSPLGQAQTVESGVTVARMPNDPGQICRRLIEVDCGDRSLAC